MRAVACSAVSARAVRTASSCPGSHFSQAFCGLFHAYFHGFFVGFLCCFHGCSHLLFFWFLGGILGCYFFKMLLCFLAGFSVLFSAFFFVVFLFVDLQAAPQKAHWVPNWEPKQPRRPSRTAPGSAGRRAMSTNSPPRLARARPHIQLVRSHVAPGCPAGRWSWGSTAVREAWWGGGLGTREGSTRVLRE